MTERENTAADGPDQEDEEVRRGREERLRKVWAAQKVGATGRRNNTEVGICTRLRHSGYVIR